MAGRFVDAENQKLRWNELVGVRSLPANVPNISS